MTRTSAPRQATTLAAALLAYAVLAHAQGPPPTDTHDATKNLAFEHAQVAAPEVPEPIKVAAGERLLLRAHAAGVQIYVCEAGADRKARWTLKEPQAELLDEQGAVIGHHSAGPSWRHRDGSAVTGKATAKVDSPDPASIPWLLVAATGHSGKGVLTSVTSVQRINTQGGQPPVTSSCTSGTGRKLKEARVPYSADYYFYAAGGS